jgi:SAM-dependent methyltransferase
MAQTSASGHQGHEHAAGDSSADRLWLAATWPFIRGQLPPPPARVAELGCGPLGGHVPALIRAGYDATGVDPEAPEGPRYVRATFEEYRPDDPADAVVASVSLHHVGDPAAVVDHVAGILAPDGVVVVVEWLSEDFDEATARWCFRQDGPSPWLGELHAGWITSGLAWDAFFRAWLDQHGLHAAAAIRRALDGRFTVTHLSTGPYYFPDLPDGDAAAEQAAIDTGQIRAGCLRYAGRLKPLRLGPGAWRLRARDPLGVSAPFPVRVPARPRDCPPRPGASAARTARRRTRRPPRPRPSRPPAPGRRRTPYR